MHGDWSIVVTIELNRNGANAIVIVEILYTKVSIKQEYG